MGVGVGVSVSVTVLAGFFLKGVCICCHERHYSLVGFVRGGFDLLGFDMGGCFPCFGSSNKEGSGGVRVKEVPNRDSSFKEAAASVVPQSHHPSRVNSGLPPNFGNFLSQTSHALFDWMMASLAWFQLSSVPPFLYFFLVFLAMCFSGCFDLVHLRLCLCWCSQ